MNRLGQLDCQHLLYGSSFRRSINRCVFRDALKDSSIVRGNVKFGLFAGLRESLMQRTLTMMCFALLTFCSTTAIAATFCVNDATKLREALITAAANGQADVIQLERGVYRGGFVYASGADSGAEGSVKLQGGFGVGCSSRIVSASNTVLDGRSRSRVLGLFGHYGEDFAIEGLTLKNGYAKGPGGGVYVSTDAEFLMTHTTVDTNVARNGEHVGVGGGLYVKATVVDISSHSRVTNNRADSDGGGLYVDARILSVTDSRILENSSRGTVAVCVRKPTTSYWRTTICSTTAPPAGAAAPTSTATRTSTNSHSPGTGFCATWRARKAAASTSLGSAPTGHFARITFSTTGRLWAGAVC